ncbi:hypothetical protein Tco_0450518 [Tanacetum coccineum]
MCRYGTTRDNYGKRMLNHPPSSRNDHARKILKSQKKEEEDERRARRERREGWSAGSGDSQHGHRGFRDTLGGRALRNAYIKYLRVLSLFSCELYERSEIDVGVEGVEKVNKRNVSWEAQGINEDFRIALAYWICMKNYVGGNDGECDYIRISVQDRNKQQRALRCQGNVRSTRKQPLRELERGVKREVTSRGSDERQAQRGLCGRSAGVTMRGDRRRWGGVDAGSQLGILATQSWTDTAGGWGVREV